MWLPIREETPLRYINAIFRQKGRKETFSEWWIFFSENKVSTHSVPPAAVFWPWLGVLGSI